MIGCLRTCVRKQPIIVLYSETACLLKVFKGYLPKDFIVGLCVKLDQLINKETMLLLTAQESASIVPAPFVKKERLFAQGLHCGPWCKT